MNRELSLRFRPTALGFLVMIYCFCPAQETIILQPGPSEGKDAMAQTIYPTLNMGDENNFIAAAWTYQGVFGITRSFLSFDLSCVPAGTIISEARLDLYFNPTSGHEGHSGLNESYLRRITESWEETTLTWNNQPGYTTMNQVFLPPSQTPEQDFTDIDVTELVKDMILYPEESHGFVLMLQVEELYRSLIFCSSDHTLETKRPRLTISLCTPPTAGYDMIEDQLCYTLTDTSAFATSWLWDFGDGTFSYLQNPVHCYAFEGVYNLCLIVSNACGADTLCKIVRPELTGFEGETEWEGQVLAPNPAHGSISVRWPASPGTAVSYSIHDLSGRIVSTGTFSITAALQKGSIDISILNPGVYFLVTTSENRMDPVKFMVY